MARASASRGAFSTSARPTRISPEPPSSIPGCCAAAISRKAPLTLRNSPYNDSIRRRSSPRRPPSPGASSAVPSSARPSRRARASGEGALAPRFERARTWAAKQRRELDRRARHGGGEPARVADGLGPRRARGRAALARAAAGACRARPARAASLRAPRPPRRRARAPARAPPRAPRPSRRPALRWSRPGRRRRGARRGRRSGRRRRPGPGGAGRSAARRARADRRRAPRRPSPPVIRKGSRRPGNAAQRGVLLEHQHALAAHARAAPPRPGPAARRPAPRRPSGACAGSRSRRARAGRASARAGAGGAISSGGLVAGLRFDLADAVGALAQRVAGARGCRSPARAARSAASRCRS